MIFVVIYNLYTYKDGHMIRTDKDLRREVQAKNRTIAADKFNIYMSREYPNENGLVYVIEPVSFTKV